MGNFRIAAQWGWGFSIFTIGGGEKGNSAGTEKNVI
jgi:hypothetical protein